MADWKEYTLEQLLSYEQPTLYLVESTDYNDNYETPVLTAGKTFILGYTNEKSGIYTSLPVIIFDDFTTASRYVNFEFKVKSSAMKILTANTDLVLPKFIFYRMQIIQFDSSTHKRYWIQKYSKIKVAIPDLKEQQRIVSKIEELFSQLDSGVETLKKTKEQLAVYRQAVLKEAFNDVSKFDAIRNVSEIVTSGSRGWAKYYSNMGSKFIRIGNLTRTGIGINFNGVQYIELPDRVEGLRSKLYPNDVLISITADLGSIALIPENIGEAYINQHIALVRFKNKHQGKFMAWYLRSWEGQKDLLKNKRGAGKLGLGLDDIRDSRVPIVTDYEADRIVAMIESHLSICESIEKTIDSAMLESEAMRQSILKQVFEGEL